MTKHEQKRVSEANVLWLNTLAFFESISMQGGVHLLEHPRDPGQEPYPSFWDTDVTQMMEERCKAHRRDLDQCPFGGLTKKATTMSTTLPGSEVLCRECPGVSATHVHCRSEGLDEHGNFNTRKLEVYPPELCLVIARLFLAAFAKMLAESSGPGGSSRPFPRRPLVSRWSMVEGPSGPGVAVLNEAYVDGKPVRVNERNGAMYLHVDDGLFFSAVGSSAPAGVLTKAVVEELREVGFVINDMRLDNAGAKVVGYVPHQSKPLLEVPLEKVALLDASMTYLAKGSWVQLKLAEAVLGVWLWAALLRRDLLCLPFHVFAMLRQDAVDGWIRWWPSAKKEWEMMRRAIVLMKADLARPVAGTLFATDAQGGGEGDAGGYGVVAATLGSDMVKKVLLEGRVPRRTVVNLAGEVDKLKHPEVEFKRSAPFSSVPRDLLDIAVWRDLRWGRWKYHDHITLGECRAVSKMLGQLASFPSAHGYSIVSLEDNMPVCGSNAKGRSSSYPLNAVMRRKTALILACNWAVVLPWIDTHAMPADHLSRLV